MSSSTDQVAVDSAAPAGPWRLAWRRFRAHRLGWFSLFVAITAVPVAADTLRDLQAAHAAGCEPHLVRTGRAAGLDESQIEQWCQQVPGVHVPEVVDTVGAGDGFAVGMISALLENHSFADAVKRANWIGSRAVQSRGDMEGLPTRAELPPPFTARSHAPAWECSP